MEARGVGDGIWLDFARPVLKAEAWFARHFHLSRKSSVA